MRKGSRLSSTRRRSRPRRHAGGIVCLCQTAPHMRRRDGSCASGQSAWCRSPDSGTAESEYWALHFRRHSTARSRVTMCMRPGTRDRWTVASGRRSEAHCLVSGHGRLLDADAAHNAQGIQKLTCLNSAPNGTSVILVHRGIHVNVVRPDISRLDGNSAPKIPFELSGSTIRYKPRTKFIFGSV